MLQKFIAFSTWLSVVLGDKCFEELDQRNMSKS